MRNMKAKLGLSAVAAAAAVTMGALSNTASAADITFNRFNPLSLVAQVTTITSGSTASVPVAVASPTVNAPNKDKPKKSKVKGDDDDHDHGHDD